MKFEARQPFTQITPVSTGFNYRGPEQNLKSLQSPSDAQPTRAMLDLLAGDLCLEKLFARSCGADNPPSTSRPR